MAEGNDDFEGIESDISVDSDDDSTIGYVFDLENEGYSKDDIEYRKKLIHSQSIGELLLFLVSISLIILHISGVLILGTIGLVVCGAIVFSALSYFMGTYFGTKYYRQDYAYKDNRGDTLEQDKVRKLIICWLKFVVLPIIFLGIGITLLVLGITGGLGLGLALGFGISSIALFAFSAVHFVICGGKITSIPDIGKEEKSRKAWIILMAIILSLAVATSLALGFLGILGWGSVLVFFIIPSAVIASAKILTKVYIRAKKFYLLA